MRRTAQLLAQRRAAVRHAHTRRAGATGTPMVRHAAAVTASVGYAPYGATAPATWRPSVAWRGPGATTGAASTTRGMCTFEPGYAVRMPALSPTMTVGEIVEWLVEEGDEVSAGAGLCDIQTDKATMALETLEDGHIARILSPAKGGEVPVGSVIAVMVEEEDDLAAVQAMEFPPEALLPEGDSAASAPAAESDGAAAPAPAAAPSAATPPAAVGGATPGSGPTGGFVTPAARHLIDREGLDGSAIPASGPGGRVLKADVLAFLGRLPPQLPWAAQQKQAAAAAADGGAGAGAGSASGAPAAAPATATAAPPATPASAAFEREGGTYTDEKPSMMRSVIASRLTESKATVPHFYATMDCYIDSLMEVRKQLKAAGVKVSVNDMIIRACALALGDVPQANAFWDEASGKVVENEAVDVCVAVATPGGLITPIVKGANQLTMPAINSTVADLATRARDNRLAPHEFQGGSFTISNLGMFGVDEFSAVINPPQAAILAVGGGAQELVFPDDDDSQPPVVATRMTVQLSADRRVMDEAVAGQFLQVMRQYLHTPILL